MKKGGLLSGLGLVAVLIGVLFLSTGCGLIAIAVVGATGGFGDCSGGGGRHQGPPPMDADQIAEEQEDLDFFLSPQADQAFFLCGGDPAAWPAARANASLIKKDFRTHYLYDYSVSVVACKQNSTFDAYLRCAPAGGSSVLCGQERVQLQRGFLKKFDVRQFSDQLRFPQGTAAQPGCPRKECQDLCVGVSGSDLQCFPAKVG